MKQTMLITFLLLLSCLVYSQKVIENPRIGMSSAPYLKLEKIELRDSATVLWFHINFTPGNWIRVPTETYIQEEGTPNKLFVVTAEGIDINKEFFMPASGETSYKLFFPKISASANRIDYGESNEGSSWFIYDIVLKPELFKSIIPSAISGNWFRSDNAQWEISLLDSVAIYKNQVWKYQQYTEKGGIGKLDLKNESKTITLYTKSVNDSTCMAGETQKKLTKYSHKAYESATAMDNEPYKAPVFKIDTITYFGYVNNFSKRFPQRTGMIYVNNVITGEQESHIIKIADDGSFKVKFAHSNPEGILVRFPMSYETVYLEPGKTTFHLIDISNTVNPHLFMGDCARLNNDLMKVKSIDSFDYNKLMEKVANSTPEQYKSWLQELQQKDLQAVTDFSKIHPLSAKAMQVKEMQIRYRYAEYIMSYNMNANSAWRKNNNIPPDQREISYKPAKTDSSYYSFLTNELVNNPLAVIIPEYFFFINRLMYMELLRDNPYSGFTTSDILSELQKSALTMTAEEKEMASKMKEINAPETIKYTEEFNEKYGAQLTAFYKKYREKLNDLYKENKDAVETPDMIGEFLEKQHIETTQEEKALLNAQKEYNAIPEIQKMIQIQTQLSKPISEFYTNRRDFINEVIKKRSAIARNEKIQKVLGIQIGLATDIMCSQDICRPIVSEMTPCTENTLSAVQKEITTPFIASYIALKNNEIKAKLEENKKMTGAKVNEVPKTDGDKLFDAIMEKYKGKVVYVDFWATWCAPCRSGIERIKPLKDEMEKENVVFVYISAPTSPKATYDNMIPTIKGEHYRASQDEWNTLCSKFNISGIPHCVLVGKDGKVINAHLPYMGNEQLKPMLMKYISE